MQPRRAALCGAGASPFRHGVRNGCRSGDGRVVAVQGRMPPARRVQAAGASASTSQSMKLRTLGARWLRLA